MPELRLTLLVVGLIFLVGLAWWELRRPHQVRGSDLPRPAPEPQDRPAERTADWDLPSPSALNRSRSPELELPRMSARDPEAELPVVEVGPAEFAAFEARAEVAPTSAAQVPARHVEPAEHNDEVVQEDFAADFAAPEASFLDSRFGEDFAHEVAAEPAAAAPATAGVDGLLDELGFSQIADPPISDIKVTAGPDGHAESQPEPESAPEPEPEPEPVLEPVLEPESVHEPAAAPGAPASAVIVEWPTAEASRVLAVRVLSVGEKFAGRAVRMALAAEGFVLGTFEIFHKPGADGRALLSIASLNKPGTFDIHTIDMQRYGGLNLFAVLPGPLPAPAALEELLACAQILAQRLHGALQDEHGAPLTPARTAALRSLAAAAPT